VVARVKATGAQERTLPVAPALVEWLGPALQRGVTVAVTGSTAGAAAVSLQLAAGASAAGSWAVAVGLPDLGLVAAAEAGVALERLALIPEPGSSWADVVAAVIDGFDVVLARPPTRLKAGAARRLVARARERGTVLVGVGGWPEGASARIELTGTKWEGLEYGDGTGHLRAVHRTLHPTGRIFGSMPAGDAAGSPRRARRTA
jgi:hypothetical protein